jgi:hypothetical protein
VSNADRNLKIDISIPVNGRLHQRTAEPVIQQAIAILIQNLEADIAAIVPGATSYKYSYDEHRWGGEDN